jgi:hypothetical protein
VPAPDITKHPESQTIVVGQKARFEVNASGTGNKYQWKKGDDEISGETSAVYEPTVTAADDGATFTVVVESSDGEKKESNEATLTVVDTVPLLFDPGFAQRAAIWLIVAMVLVALPILIIAFRTAGESGSTIPRFPGAVSIQLVVVGMFVACLAAYIALLEFRGKSRTLQELNPPKPPQAQEGGPWDAVVNKVPEILKTLSNMKIPAALLAVAIVCFISAASVSWRALPQPTPSPSPTTTTSTQPSTPDTPPSDNAGQPSEIPSEPGQSEESSG